MFDASDRNRRFLKYIVEETLASRGSRIKGYSIGISVFGRESNFDPQIDPVVRVEAGRLRRSLERYYLTDGRRAHVKISVPKGSYVANFELLKKVDPAAERPSLLMPSEDRFCSILVMPFISLSGSEELRRFALALTEELIVEFGEYPELDVFMLPDRSMERQEPPQNPRENDARVVVMGSVRVVAGNVRVIAHLVDRIDNRRLWSTSFNRDLTRPVLSDLEREIGHEIVAALTARLGKETRTTMEH
jgi:adenylate cyclase